MRGRREEEFYYKLSKYEKQLFDELLEKMSVAKAEEEIYRRRREESGDPHRPLRPVLQRRKPGERPKRPEKPKKYRYTL